jgi:ferredoxin
MVLRHRKGRRIARTPPAAAVKPPWTLRVDPIACDGRGVCAEVLPQLISLDDWGFPIIRAGPVPDHLQGEAREALRICPKLALRLDLGS